MGSKLQMLNNLYQQIGYSMEEPAGDGGEASCDGEEHCKADKHRLPGGELYILMHLRRLTMMKAIEILSCI